jgi:hypothetical protein
MSLVSWARTHYPRPANTVRRRVTALTHTLRKWRGLRPVVLRQHHLVCHDGQLEDEWDGAPSYPLYIDASTCALCTLYLPGDCHECPVSRIRANGVRVYCDTPGEPYAIWYRTGNPEPMITVLEAALRKHRRRAKSTRKT